tara:strand:+ start:147 stop:344 length:198 start_codon:yes stop_codon:yes gene_type:complete
MNYSSKDYAFIQHALYMNNMKNRDTKFVNGNIYIECSSDAMMNKLWDVIEAAGVNPNMVNFCLWN